MTRPIGKACVIFHPLDESVQEAKQTCPSDKNCDICIPVDKFRASTAVKVQCSYPVKVIIPQYASCSVCSWVYFLSYGGGLVEGDHLQLQLDVHEQCCVLLTTQSSTKVYLCEEGKMSKQDINCTVGPGALLAIIPHTIIPFKKARFTQKQKVSMAVDSNLVLLDWITAGHVATGELWQFDRVATCNQIEVDGQVIYREALCLEDSPYQTVARAMGNYEVIGTLLLLGPLLLKLINKLLAEFGKPKRYDDTYNCASLTSISPLKYPVKTGVIQGCVIRFAGQNTTMVQELIDSILKPLYPVLGGEPLKK